MAQYKNYVGELQEKLASRGISPPTYTCLHSEGLPHSPTFTYNLSVGVTNVIGKGESKKDAKQEAAKNMLLDIKEKEQNLESLPTEKGGIDSDKVMEKNIRIPSQEGNSISKLQELCQNPALRLPMPLYNHSTMPSEEDPLGRMFWTTCTVGELSSEGRWWNNQESKQEAATKMLEKCLQLTEHKDLENTFEGMF